MTDKELRAFAKKLVCDYAQGLAPLRQADLLHGRDIPKQFIDVAYQSLVNLRAKMQAESR